MDYPSGSNQSTLPGCGRSKDVIVKRDTRKLTLRTEEAGGGQTCEWPLEPRRGKEMPPLLRLPEKNAALTII